MQFSTLDKIDNHKNIRLFNNIFVTAELIAWKLITVQTDPVDISRMLMPPWHLSWKQMLFASVFCDSHWRWQKKKSTQAAHIFKNIFGLSKHFLKIIVRDEIYRKYTPLATEKYIVLIYLWIHVLCLISNGLLSLNSKG